MLPLPAGREASSGVGALVYDRHRPERTLLYQIVEQYLPAFGAHLAARARACRRTSNRSSRTTSSAAASSTASCIERRRLAWVPEVLAAGAEISAKLGYRPPGA